jgi:hypothetical protein
MRGAGLPEFVTRRPAFITRRPAFVVLPPVHFPVSLSRALERVKARLVTKVCAGSARVG